MPIKMAIYHVYDTFQHILEVAIGKSNKWQGSHK